MTNQAYYNLARQVVLQSVYDYKDIVKRKKAGKPYSVGRYLELKKFFKSEWFYALSWGLCGEYVERKVYDMTAPMKSNSSTNSRAIQDDEAAQFVFLHDVMGWTFNTIAKRTGRSHTAVALNYKRMKGESNDN